MDEIYASAAARMLYVRESTSGSLSGFLKYGRMEAASVGNTLPASP